MINFSKTVVMISMICFGCTKLNPNKAQVNIQGVHGETRPLEHSIDTTLGGYDISLDMETFKSKYKDNIKKCFPTKYNDDDVGIVEFPVVECKLKEFDERVQFFNSKLLWLMIRAPEGSISLNIATEILEKKSGKKHKSVARIHKNGTRFCTAVVPFGAGEASVIGIHLKTSPCYSSAEFTESIWSYSKYTNDTVLDEERKKYKEAVKKAVKL